METEAPLVLVALTEARESRSPSGSEALVNKSAMGISNEVLAARANIAVPATGGRLAMAPFQKPPCIAQPPPESLPASGWPIVPVKAQLPLALTPPPPSTVYQSMLAANELGSRGTESLGAEPKSLLTTTE